MQTALIYGLLLGGIGIFTRKPAGAAFAAVAILLTVFMIWRAFQWSPDPHAKRKFLLLALAIFASGLLGAVVIDTATTEILIRMGWCPRSVGCFWPSEASHPRNRVTAAMNRVGWSIMTMCSAPSMRSNRAGSRRLR